MKFFAKLIVEMELKEILIMYPNAMSLLKRLKFFVYYLFINKNQEFNLTFVVELMDIILSSSSAINF